MNRLVLMKMKENVSIKMKKKNKSNLIKWKL